jgi:hypothetical protein
MAHWITGYARTWFRDEWLHKLDNRVQKSCIFGFEIGFAQFLILLSIMTLIPIILKSCLTKGFSGYGKGQNPKCPDSLVQILTFIQYGGDSRIRTDGLLNAIQAL